MGRNTGPVCRKCRREGMKLFLKGARCFMAKCAIETERPAPGMHGQRRGKKLSDYGVQLREKQRLRQMYGLREEQFKITFKRAARQTGVTGETLLQLLETRLDNLVFRLGYATSRPLARQLVTHGHVLVDGMGARIPSTTIKTGSVIQIKDKPKSRQLAATALEGAASMELKPWLSLDAKAFSGQLVRIPTRDEIAPIVNEQLVVELYSK